MEEKIRKGVAIPPTTEVMGFLATFIKKAKKDCAIVVTDDMEYGTPFAAGYNNGIEKGIKYVLKNMKNTMESLVAKIESGEAKTLCEYSQKPDMMKAFNDGQISALKLEILWCRYCLGEIEEYLKL